ncbi:tRNA-i(6)A37 thiotransferase enzyme MiaB [Desulforamulus reducens MI-1]|uniref:tRNA-2-methylthio-N(6)-dimethylallyladenosine synthase n=1 Tax=Desulforamulus reducens (strain ATCC BAA-1160 / DSM 100696 / MI-1) TaxID=349161 RepID=MIAB_DESRM|nr:tRNA (N6-isopentenyl adenosine(37)-C2)-methylthiotransferase MiaB [Desulforamulus reducens]A4J5Q8.1 RecName: Full=tRNA-2-methylthio-N(6)-dimethylallyladenosine synthase; AltName: Full=(Dimethylallyl)adenosine tRNA methylthiotransferase MiaB; AltName: Full=tRNA-i(6)A37 methylthiotransferase [Desulforamulus reducens MI-1]ABO50411.1 tRNA-i(6)A37 thiotransferase enzyme MiaB [Desulforamulus reducens MI-1]
MAEKHQDKMTNAMNNSKLYLIQSFGCQMNERDAESLAGMLEDLGYCPTSAQEEADIILLNTCCVRETAESKVFGLLGRLRKLKVAKPDLILGVCGCMSQQEDAAKRIRRSFPFVDLIFGTHNIHELPRMIHQVQENHEAVLEVWATEKGITESIPVKRKDKLKAWVTIMYGCNNFCTYCIVPYVRGRERSRQPEDIIDEIKELVQEGYKEVTLLGQNVNSYGKDFKNNYRFADLLMAIDDITGLERVRFMTSHPRDFDQRLIEVVASAKKVCEHYHLPAQAGSNRVLKMMNRGYTREHYLELIRKIKERVPNASITADLMVGFPGETEEDFQETLDLVKQVRYDSAFTFVYNIRSGTPAAKLEQVSEEVKSERIQRLIELQNLISLENNQREEGRVLEVLVEGETKTNPDLLAGRTRTNKLVVFQGSGHLPGQLVQIRITKGRPNLLEGEVVPNGT